MATNPMTRSGQGRPKRPSNSRPRTIPPTRPATLATSTRSASQPEGLPAMISLRRMASLVPTGVKRRATVRAALERGLSRRSRAGRASSRLRRSAGRSSTARMAWSVRYAWRRSVTIDWTE